MHSRTLALCWAVCIGAAPEACRLSAADVSAALGFPEAWRRIEERSPELKAAANETQAADDLRRQASARPNPSLETELEDFGGTGARAGTGASETTLSLRQAIEPGGRRGVRIAAAAADLELARAEADLRRLDLWAEAARAYVGAFAAAERERLAREEARIAGEAAELAGRKAEAGKATPLEAQRARVESILAGQQAARAAREAASARRTLAALWNGGEPDFAALSPLPLPDGGVPPRAELERRAGEAPALRRLDRVAGCREAGLRAARADRIPEIEVSAGVRHAAEDDERSFVAGVGVGLPIFDRRAGSIASAGRLLEAARQEREALAARIRAEAAALADTADAALAEARALEGEALPAARANYEAARFGFEQGKFRYLDLLDAERSLVEVGRRQLEAVAACHAALGDLARLLGDPTIFPGSPSNPSR